MLTPRDLINTSKFPIVNLPSLTIYTIFPLTNVSNVMTNTGIKQTLMNVFLELPLSLIIVREMICMLINARCVITNTNWLVINAFYQLLIAFGI